jgi:hypothetical protein
MPKLIYFLACEKMVLDEEAPVPSFITVFDALTIPPPPADAENIQLPLRWQLVSFWRKLPEDEGKIFQQQTLLVSPDGKEIAPSILEFSMSGTGHRNNVRVFGFPASPPGDYFARLFIREVGQNDWLQVAEYPISVRHIESRLPA